MDPVLGKSAAEGRYVLPGAEANASGISWAAVAGGAFAIAALALILLMLGVGLGLSSISPWAAAGPSSRAIGAATIVWLILTQALASAMGGYLAGRLRTKWASIHSDEVYFRDTAHGFLAWAVGVVITAAFLTSAATSIVGASVALGREPVAAAAMTAPAAEPGARSTADASAAQSAMQERAEAQTSGREAAEMARRGAAKASLWLFVALLTGAFCASLAATFGGRQRDRVPAAVGYQAEARR
jgi:hypothetical protein